MTVSTVENILTEVIDLLRQCGVDDLAVWISERQDVLQASDATNDAREHAMNELHGAVLGMGGLFDLYLVPAAGSPHTTTSARERLDVLSDRLYELTR